MASHNTKAGKRPKSLVLNQTRKPAQTQALHATTCQNKTRRGIINNYNYAASKGKTTALDAVRNDDDTTNYRLLRNTGFVHGTLVSDTPFFGDEGRLKKYGASMERLLTCLGKCVRGVVMYFGVDTF